jgi:tRNA 2-thiouridine synthesizing protein A
MNDRTADRTLDLRGLLCPLPVLKSRRALKAMPAGAQLTVDTSDPVASIDLPHFCREDGHRLLAQERTDFGMRFVIEKGA